MANVVIECWENGHRHSRVTKASAQKGLTHCLPQGSKVVYVNTKIWLKIHSTSRHRKKYRGLVTCKSDRRLSPKFYFNCRRLTLKKVDFTNNLRRIKLWKLILFCNQLYKHFCVLIDKVNIFSVNFINNLCATFWHEKINSIIKSILLIISAHCF
jgi:hypothetical protein